MASARTMRTRNAYHCPTPVQWSRQGHWNNESSLRRRGYANAALRLVAVLASMLPASINDVPTLLLPLLAGYPAMERLSAMAARRARDPRISYQPSGEVEKRLHRSRSPT